MTEEENKAIYRLDMHSKASIIANGCCIVNVADVATVLNLIQKQKEDVQRIQEIADKVNATLLEQQKELQNKDKIIDEMAQYIKEPYQVCIYKNRISKIDAIKQFFERLVEKEAKE